MAITRGDLLRRRIADITLGDLQEIRDFSKVLMIYEKIGGFSSAFVVDAVRVIKEMLNDKECKIFLGFTANLIATGLRGLIASLIAYRLVDIIVTTGGTVDHDIARALGGRYYHGKFEYDDIMLKNLEIHRLGNVLIPVENYGPIIEKFTHELLEELLEIKEVWTPSELLKESGKRLDDENSILFQAAKNNVSIFSPGIIDSAFGTALFTYNETKRASKGKTLKLDVIGDLRRISDVVFDSQKLGAIILGGGISKHHIIWWSQFKGGLDYAVYITTAVEWDGSLSGARTREAISWGKVKPEARHINVPGDVTIIFPLIMGIISQDLDHIKRR